MAVLSLHGIPYTKKDGIYIEAADSICNVIEF